MSAGSLEDSASDPNIAFMGMRYVVGRINMLFNVVLVGMRNSYWGGECLCPLGGAGGGSLSTIAKAMEGDVGNGLMLGEGEEMGDVKDLERGRHSEFRSHRLFPRLSGPRMRRTASASRKRTGKSTLSPVGRDEGKMFNLKAKLFGTGLKVRPSTRKSELFSTLEKNEEVPNFVTKGMLEICAMGAYSGEQALSTHYDHARPDIDEKTYLSPMAAEKRRQVDEAKRLADFRMLCRKFKNKVRRQKKKTVKEEKERSSESVGSNGASPKPEEEWDGDDPVDSKVGVVTGPSAAIVEKSVLGRGGAIRDD